MNRRALILLYSQRTHAEQIDLLALVAHALTIDARGTYLPGTEGVADPARLRGIVELQHRVAGQLLSQIRRDQARFPDEDFSQMLWAGLEDLRCTLTLSKLRKGLEGHGHTRQDNSRGVRARAG